MTIIFFSRLFFPHIGGVEKHVFEISKKLIKQGHKVIVVTEQHDKKLNLRESYFGIKIYRIPFKFVNKENWIKKFNIWFWFWKNLKLIESADIAHYHDVFFWYLPFRFIFPNKKVFTTFHGYEGNKIPSKKAVLMHKIAEKFSYGNICVGDYLKKWYGTKPTYITYGGIGILPINTDTTNKYQSKNKILFIGRLEEETGIMVYLEALKILKEKRLNFIFTVFGDGSLRQKAETFCKKNKLDVEFKGFIKNAEKYINNYDYIFTSRYLGILESLAAKKNVFAVYNNKVKEDYLKMTPFAKWITIEKSPSKLAKEVKYFILYKKINVEILNAYEWVKNETWNKMTKTYLDLWSM